MENEERIERLVQLIETYETLVDETATAAAAAAAARVDQLSSQVPSSSSSPTTVKEAAPVVVAHPKYKNVLTTVEIAGLRVQQTMVLMKYNFFDKLNRLVREVEVSINEDLDQIKFYSRTNRDELDRAQGLTMLMLKRTMPTVVSSDKQLVEDVAEHESSYQTHVDSLKLCCVLDTSIKPGHLVVWAHEMSEVDKCREVVNDLYSKKKPPLKENVDPKPSSEPLFCIKREIVFIDDESGEKSSSNRQRYRKRSSSSSSPDNRHRSPAKTKRHVHLGSHEANSSSRRSSSGHVVFVYNLPFQMERHEIMQRFVHCGRILEISMYKNRKTRDFIGSALLEFDTKEAAQRALQMDAKCPKGLNKPLRVKEFNPDKPESPILYKSTARFPYKSRK